MHLCNVHCAKFHPVFPSKASEAHPSPEVSQIGQYIQQPGRVSKKLTSKRVFENVVKNVNSNIFNMEKKEVDIFVGKPKTSEGKEINKKEFPERESSG